MSSDTMSLTGVKNRLSRSFLEMQLNSLDRQKSSELKSSNNEMKKFRNKYSKLEMLVEGKVNYVSVNVHTRIWLNAKKVSCCLQIVWK